MHLPCLNYSVVLRSLYVAQLINIDVWGSMGELFLYLPEAEDGLLCAFFRPLLKTEVF